MNKRTVVRTIVHVLCLLSFVPVGAVRVALAQGGDPSPPAEPVKLIFIHHSTGGNWLADPNGDQPYGGLGMALRDNNYFVSATNYGWGPDGIGDRTDIINWPEWFTGPNSAAYLEALYNESGQNVGDFGAWSRLGSDPGGENEIVMFKSCFPNSDLYGSPTDPPAAEVNDQYTVANAKAVYNRLLTYFATRQDKLFVVITAPPLTRDETTRKRAANARAFNNWLVREWLDGYPHPNVAVFDYYNVLTAADNHHRWREGEIEHLQPVDGNFAAYPSGDSHPNTEGHSKAAAEFVPLLNVFYHRWRTADAAAPSPTATATGETLPTPTSTPAAAPPDDQADEPTPTASPGSAAQPPGTIEDWEGEDWWESYGDGMDSTVRSAIDTTQAHGGSGSLRIAFDITAEGWGDTGTSFAEAQDWSAGDGVAFWLHADVTGYPARLVLFAGDADAPTPFEAEFVTSDAHVKGWARVVLPWETFAVAPWHDGSGLDEIDPARITGLSFNFSPGAGTMWVDDLGLSSGEVQPPTATPASEQPAPTATPAIEQAPETTPDARGGLCAGSMALSAVVLAAWLFWRRQ